MKPTKVPGLPPLVQDRKIGKNKKKDTQIGLKQQKDLERQSNSHLLSAMSVRPKKLKKLKAEDVSSCLLCMLHTTLIISSYLFLARVSHFFSITYCYDV